MKRISSSDSPGALISICTSTDEQKMVYSRELQSMLDGYDEEEACLMEEGSGQKKRRLSVVQVKALEKSFEVENKLEPERKAKLAQELGLQPRQVAVWFQNRRARWKTKQLERDYGVLKSNYDSLKLNLDSLQSDNQALIKEIRKLRSQLNEESPESQNVSEKEGLGSESDNPETELPAINTTPEASSMEGLETLKQEFKDAGPSDSDSSAILNADDINNSPKADVAAAFLHPENYQNGAGFEFLNLSSDSGADAEESSYHIQYVKMEEHNFFSEEAPCCNFFSDDQAPTLHWYTPENWT